MSDLAMMASIVQATEVEHEPTFLGLDAGGWVALAMIAVFAIFIWKKVPGAIAGALDGKIALIRDQLAEAESLRKEAQIAETRLKAGDISRADKSQIEIAAELMGMTPEEVRPQVMKASHTQLRQVSTNSRDPGAARTFVVEKRVVRRVAVPSRFGS